MKIQILVFTVLSAIPQTKTDESAILYQYCQNRDDCGRFGYVCAQNRSCLCDMRYIPNRMRDKCVGGVGQYCKYDEHCIGGAFCEYQSQCKCKEDFFPIQDGLICSGAIHQQTVFKLFPYLTLIFCLILLLQ